MITGRLLDCPGCGQPRWSGVGPCEGCGAASPEWIAETKKINFVRALHGLPSIAETGEDYGATEGSEG